MEIAQPLFAKFVVQRHNTPTFRAGRPAAVAVGCHDRRPNRSMGISHLPMLNVIYPNFRMTSVASVMSRSA